MLIYKENIEFEKFPITYFVSNCAKENDVIAPPHWHDEIEILIIKNGNAIVSIDENIYKVSKDDIVIIWVGQFHAVYDYYGCKCEIAVLQFDLTAFVAPFVSKNVVHQLENLKFVDKITDSECKLKIETILNEVINELENNSDGMEYKLSSLINQFYCLIVKNRNNCKIVSKKMINDNIKSIASEIFNYIENNYYMEITLGDACRVAKLSTAHFSRIFKTASGMTFFQYLNCYRISKSIYFLKKGNNVTETAQKCGFNDINTFIRNFKKYNNCTPSKYIVKN